MALWLHQKDRLLIVLQDRAIDTTIKMWGCSPRWCKSYYTQITCSPMQAAALLPSGRMVIWGNYQFYATTHGFPSAVVPQEVNSILFPQTASRLSDGGGPDAGELSMLEAGGLGIRWGAGNPQYEVETTTDLADENSWAPLPTDADNRFYRIQQTNE